MSEEKKSPEDEEPAIADESESAPADLHEEPRPRPKQRYDGRIPFYGASKRWE